jgi:GNAT superfamily N-acetyltransferase
MKQPPLQQLCSSDENEGLRVTIRLATIADVGLIRRLIKELAEFEKEPDQVRTTESDLVRDGFGVDPQFRTLIGEWCGEPVGFAVFFHYYSTWRGPGLYLEDLYVSPEFRRRGIGKALLSRVARIAEDEDRAFVRWAVLNWNTSAIDLYKSLGGHFLNDWRIVLLTGDGLKRLAERSS